MVGATIVMIHPAGILDLHYLSSVIGDKQVTILGGVPTLFINLLNFVKECRTYNQMNSLRLIISGGM